MKLGCQGRAALTRHAYELGLAPGLGPRVEVVDRPTGDQRERVFRVGLLVRGQVLGGLENRLAVGVEGAVLGFLHRRPRPAGAPVGWADPEAELAMAYTMNQMSMGTTGDTRSANLAAACYASLA